MIFETWTAQTWFTAYAAVIASLAFILNLKLRWDKKPRLKLKVMLNVIVIGGELADDSNGLTVLTVINRGELPTQITHMILFKYSGFWSRVFGKPIKQALIAHPEWKGSPSILPSVLNASGSWQGVMRNRFDDYPDLYEGNFSIGVIANHRDKPYLHRLFEKKAGSSSPRNAVSAVAADSR